MAASTAELSNSTINPSKHTAIRIARSTRVTGSQKANGISTTLASTSWRNAASPLKAVRRPSNEYPAALKIRLRPVWPLNGDMDGYFTD